MIYKETHEERQTGQSIKSYFMLESGRFDRFEIAMTSKTLYIYICCFFYVQYEFLIFFNFFFQVLMTRSQVMTN